MNPLPAGEVGEVYHGSSARDRHFRQPRNGAPCGRVVAVHRRRFFVADRIDKVIHHDVVHPAVTGFFGLQFEGAPQLVVVFLKPVIRRIPAMRLRLSFDIDMVAVVHPQPSRALNAEAKRIGARQVGVVRDDDGLPVGAFNHRGDDIAEVKVNLRIRVVCSAFVYDEVM